MKNEFFPIILGSDENAYGMARLFFEKYKIKPLLLCSKPLVCTMHSKILEVQVIKNFDTNDVFIENIIRIAKEKLESYNKLLLIPCSDGYSLLAVQNQSELKKYFANHFISEDMFVEFSTKDKFYELCEKHNLPYPKTIICQKQDRLNVFEENEIKFPIVVKANNSNSYSYLNSDFKGKSKVYFFDTKEQYFEMIKEMNNSNYDENLIIQEFIPGDDSCMRVVNCYSDKTGKVRFMIVGQAVLEEYTPHAIGNYAAIITSLENSFCEQIKAFLEDINYVGFSNFDLKFDSRDNSFKLFEINPRQGRSSFFVKAAGYNLAEYLVNDLIFDKNADFEIGTNIALWSTVPKGILKKYVNNDLIKNQINNLIKAKKLTFTLFYKNDFSIIRFLKIYKYYLRHYKNFKNYFFNKDGKNVH